MPTPPKRTTIPTTRGPTSRVKNPGGPHPDHGVRTFKLGEATDSLHQMREELDIMRDVLMGRVQPPIDNGVMTLYEVADAYYARAKEMEQTIHRDEADGNVLRGSKHYRFRTGELRSFIEMAKGAAELGSRRVTAAKMEFDMEREAGGR